MDRARLAAALKHELLLHRHELHIHTDFDLAKIADAIATGLIASGATLPAPQAKPLGRRAPIDIRPAALRN
jgi:hypothetical protein